MSFTITPWLNPEGQCPVCQEEFELNDENKTSGHLVDPRDPDSGVICRVHSLCLERLAESELNKCPLCNTEITSVHGVPIVAPQQQAYVVPTGPLTQEEIDQIANLPIQDELTQLLRHALTRILEINRILEAQPQ